MGNLIDSLRAAADASPEDAPLRLHLAELLLQAKQPAEALQEVGQVLRIDPTSVPARALIEQVQRQMTDASANPGPTKDEADGGSGIDWRGLERDLGVNVPPMFVESGAGSAKPSEVPAWDVEPEEITLADVGGLEAVKERLEVAFLAPLRNPELRKLYRKQLRGGLMLYGPPGCGKSFIARALAGELQAGFMSVSINDVLDMYLGVSEKNLHEIFRTARRTAPTVLFFDEIDALGRRRSQLSNDAMRATVNQLLGELDGIDSSDENVNVFVLAATNHPWDVDPALRRPGRFDRTMLVLPPDESAREVIFRTHLKERPVSGIDLRSLALATEGYSGADIQHVCDTAAEKAMVDSVRSGTIRMIEMRDLEAALEEVNPSTGEWFQTAGNVVQFANGDGTYDELSVYMNRKQLT
jgi:AAA+ superfamily predicted ATPase